MARWKTFYNNTVCNLPLNDDSKWFITVTCITGPWSWQISNGVMRSTANIIIAIWWLLVKIIVIILFTYPKWRKKLLDFSWDVNYQFVGWILIHSHTIPWLPSTPWITIGITSNQTAILPMGQSMKWLVAIANRLGMLHHPSFLKNQPLPRLSRWFVG